jgi:hypothetical protein
MHNLWTIAGRTDVRMKGMLKQLQRPINRAVLYRSVCIGRRGMHWR